MMTLPVAFYVLVWVFATPDGTERQINFTNKFEKIECVSHATELHEQIKSQKLRLSYSRFVCVPVTEQ